jgi:hypothetical protein
MPVAESETKLDSISWQLLFKVVNFCLTSTFFSLKAPRAYMNRCHKAIGERNTVLLDPKS